MEFSEVGYRTYNSQANWNHNSTVTFNLKVRDIMITKIVYLLIWYDFLGCWPIKLLFINIINSSYYYKLLVAFYLFSIFRFHAKWPTRQRSNRRQKKNQKSLNSIRWTRFNVLRIEIRCTKSNVLRIEIRWTKSNVLQNWDPLNKLRLTFKLDPLYKV
jgi:hypothetical protein